MPRKIYCQGKIKLGDVVKAKLDCSIEELMSGGIQINRTYRVINPDVENLRRVDCTGHLIRLDIHRLGNSCFCYKLTRLNGTLICKGTYD